MLEREINTVDQFIRDVLDGWDHSGDDVKLAWQTLKAAVSEQTAAQQLKAEILPLLEEAKKDLTKVGMLYSEQCINQVMAKLSAV